MLDLEKLAETCREKNRWTFFVTSAPANVPGTLPVLRVIDYGVNIDLGGVGSHVNGTAIF